MSADTDRRGRAAEWYAALRDRICAAFEAIEDEYAGRDAGDLPPGRFERKDWIRADGGGGGDDRDHARPRLREGRGQRLDRVRRIRRANSAAKFRGRRRTPRFWAGGISLVAHMRSPLVPAAHMNTRHIVTRKAWFGGGGDLTPIYPDDAAARRIPCRPAGGVRRS